MNKETMPTLLLEEFAQPSIRRRSDGQKNQFTEIDGFEKAVHWKTDGSDPGAGANRGAATLRDHRGGLRQTPIEVDAV
jgi:hypothetical protein